MKKSTWILGVDTGLFLLLAVCVLMVAPEVFHHSFVHVVPGLLLMAGAGYHLWLHWDWIKTAFGRFGKLPAAARTNAMVDLALFSTYLLCGGMGILARLMLSGSLHIHISLGWLHALLAVLLLGLQTLHLALHWKWIKSKVFKASGAPVSS